METFCQVVSAISIHALLAESDAVTRVASTPTTVISIHALLAESDMCHTVDRVRACISIHALLAESDNQPGKSNKLAGLFLSTLSLRRATDTSKTVCNVISISIHALLAESDPKDQHQACLRYQFLSTLSLRRATGKSQSS